MLPENTPENFRNFAKDNTVKSRIQYHIFDPNQLDLEGWKNTWILRETSNHDHQLRDRNLRGSFKSLEDLQKCFVISAEKFQEMTPYIKNSGKTTGKTDFSKQILIPLRLKQLIEFGLDERSAGSIIGFRKKTGRFYE